MGNIGRHDAGLERELEHVLLGGLSSTSGQDQGTVLWNRNGKQVHASSGACPEEKAGTPME